MPATAPIGEPSDSASPSSSTQAASNTKIRDFDFANATFITNDTVGTVKLSGGHYSGTASSGELVTVELSKNDDTGKPIQTFGDVNGDGIEDAVVTIDAGGVGNDRLVTLWLGTSSGTPKQFSKPVFSASKCGNRIGEVSIAKDGVISVSGARGVEVCAGVGAPYTATFKLNGDNIQTLTPAPALE